MCATDCETTDFKTLHKRCGFKFGLKLAKYTTRVQPSVGLFAEVEIEIEQNQPTLKNW